MENCIEITVPSHCARRTLSEVLECCSLAVLIEQPENEADLGRAFTQAWMFENMSMPAVLTGHSLKEFGFLEPPENDFRNLG